MPWCHEKLSHAVFHSRHQKDVKRVSFYPHKKNRSFHLSHINSCFFFYNFLVAFAVLIFLNRRKVYETSLVLTKYDSQNNLEKIFVSSLRTGDFFFSNWNGRYSDKFFLFKQLYICMQFNARYDFNTIFFFNRFLFLFEINYIHYFFLVTNMQWP